MEELIYLSKQEEEKWRKELPYRYWLANIPGIGKKTIQLLMHHSHDGEHIYKMTEKEAKVLLSEKQLQTFLESRRKWNVEREYHKLKEQAISFYPLDHPAFPEKLREIPDAPGGIFVKGNLPDNKAPSIAVIGARRCSEYGRYMARQYGETLAQAGIQVISGLASGIDGISQKGAVAAGGSSYGVLGCGVDICYPEENVELYEMLITKGGILSEYVPGTLPRASLFPPRNRIISGLADAILVIEAKEKSGTLITVDMALEQGKEVFALPGRVTDPLSRGCNRLLKQGAGMILSPEDLIYELMGERKDSGCNKRGTNTEVSDRSPGIPGICSPIMQNVWEILDDYPLTIEEIRSKSEEISVPELLQTLLELCMIGYAEQVSCGCYVRRH